MFFPTNPVTQIELSQNLTLQRVQALELRERQAGIAVSTSGVFDLTTALTWINFSSGLNVTGIVSSAGLIQGRIYNRGTQVNLVNLSNAVVQSQRMILPTGMTTVLGNNQWAEFVFDAGGNVWRVFL
jgi:hypothetical protein